MQPQRKMVLSSSYVVENSQPQHAALITIELFSADMGGLFKGLLSG